MHLSKEVSWARIDIAKKNPLSFIAIISVCWFQFDLKSIITLKNEWFSMPTCSRSAREGENIVIVLSLLKTRPFTANRQPNSFKVSETKFFNSLKVFSSYYCCWCHQQKSLTETDVPWAGH